MRLPLPSFLFIALLVALRLSAASERPPNVLFVIADDLNDWVGPLGANPQVKTPNIDRFAERATTFTNAHCNAPLCSPSRASLFSGLYPHTTEYYGYGQNDVNRWRNPNLLRAAVTIPEHFKAHGYVTWGAGKVMHNGDDQVAMFTGGDDDSKSAFGPGADFGPWPWNGKEKMPHPSNRPPYSGRFMGSAAPLSDIPEFAAEPENGVPGHRGWRSGWGAERPFRYVSEDDRSLMPDEESAIWAAERLRKPCDQPFFMVVGFNRPHVPWYAPKEFFELYPPEEVELPMGFRRDDREDVAPGDREPGRDWRILTEHWEDEGEGIRFGVRAYLACISFVDAQFGVLLDALEAGPHADNTIVVFTSDHGYHLFEKLHLGKITAWERSTRVPLFIHLPGQEDAARSGEPVELIDLYPTFNRLCSLPTNPNAAGNGLAPQGDDLSPLLKDPTTELGDFPVALTAVMGLPSKEHGDTYPTPKENIKFTVRSRDYRYIRTHRGEEEFYADSDDPHEWTNRIDDPAYASEIDRHRRKLQTLTESD